MHLILDGHCVSILKLLKYLFLILTTLINLKFQRGNRIFNFIILNNFTFYRIHNILFIFVYVIFVYRGKGRGGAGYIITTVRQYYETSCIFFFSTQKYPVDVLLLLNLSSYLCCFRSRHLDDRMVHVNICFNDINNNMILFA